MTYIEVRIDIQNHSRERKFQVSGVNKSSKNEEIDDVVDRSKVDEMKAHI